MTIEEQSNNKTTTMPIDYKKLYQKTLAEKKVLKKELEELQEYANDQESEADRTSELESIAWIDFYGEKQVIDDIKMYKFRDDILKMKEENKKLKVENEILKKNY